jgi:serine protease AprX
MSFRVRRLFAVTGTTLATTALTLTSVAATTGAGTAWTSAAGPRHSAVVMARAGQVAAAAAAVRASGGTVGEALPIINGFKADISDAEAGSVGRSASVASVTADAAMQAASSSYDPSAPGASYAASSRASSVWAAGDTGEGVTVAVLDTGVANVPDLSGRLVPGIDLSGEGNSLKDSYGHGTVMAGLIAGNGQSSGGAYPGLAPDARIVSVKVAGRSGASDVSTVLAGLQWIGSHRDQYGINVVSISWGTPSHQSTLVDPIDFAVERLWGMGITVVASAGNTGPGPMTVTKPGDDPAVITVGAFADAGTVSWGDDTVTPWSAQGPTADGVAKPDLVAPGRTLISVRSPGSVVEHGNPQALVSGGYIRGSGTSQATAVTAGGIALLLSAHPAWTPDQIKYSLTSTASPMRGVDSSKQGAGELRLSRAVGANPADAPQQNLQARGFGSLEASRGGQHVVVACPGSTTPVELEGETDAQCNDWSAESWSAESWSAESWSAESWSAESWSAESWSAESWSAESWSVESWS